MVDTAFPTLPVDLDGKPAFGFSDHPRNYNLFEVGNYLGRRARPRCECTKDLFKEDVWVPHIYQILNNSTLPTIGAPSIVAKLVEVFQRIAFSKIETKCSNSSRQRRVK